MVASIRLSKLLSVSAELAEEAGAIIRNVMRSKELKTIDKGGNDPQTIADRRSEQLIVGNLKRIFEGITVVGEEGESQYPPDTIRNISKPQFDLGDADKELPLESTVVWVDPLDGTREFVAKNFGAVTVLIGIALEGHPIAGVIHQPFVSKSGEEFATEDESLQAEGRTIFGAVGFGVRGLSQTLPVVAEGKAAPVCVTRSRFSATVSEAAEKAANADRKHLGIAERPGLVKMGGAGAKMLLLLEGKSSVWVYPTSGIKKWDICAGDALVRAQGGVVTDWKGDKYTYAVGAEGPESGPCNGVVAAVLPELHKAVMDTLTS